MHGRAGQFRELCECCQGGSVEPVYPDVPSCDTQAEREMQWYTDGSLVAGKHRFSLGAAGIFCPRVTHLSGLIGDLADECGVSEGGEAFVKLRAHGPTIGSTRPELVAVLCAMCQDGPVSIGTDNKAVVSGFGRLVG
eukprot:11892263-Alexandrium_andersonii.AAC.1